MKIVKGSRARGEKVVAVREPVARKRGQKQAIEREPKQVAEREPKPAAEVADVEPVAVEQPIVAPKSVRRERMRAERAAAAGKKNEAPVADKSAGVAAADAPKKPVTVDDFVRAANGGVLPGEKTAPVAQGVSHPDESERIEVSDAPIADAPKPKIATQRAAPIERAAAASVPVKSSVVVKASAAPVVKAQAAPVAVVTARNDVPALGVSFDDAPASADLPRQQKVVEGFGPEVAVTPAATATRGSSLSRKNAPPDELASHDRVLQRELADDAMQPVVVPLYSRSGKLVVPAPLKGSREVLVHQNTMADQEGLSRIQDDADLDRMRAAKLLLPLPDMDALDINPELPYNRRYARPWTVKFVGDLARAYYAKFREPLRLSSAVRTVDFQLRLQRVNGNAAAVDGDTASPHLTGQAIDFGKSGMSRAEIAWMRAYLLPVMQAGKIDVEEEFQQACFHISVYSSYAPKKRVLRQELASVHGD